MNKDFPLLPIHTDLKLGNTTNEDITSFIISNMDCKPLFIYIHMIYYHTNDNL